MVIWAAAFVTVTSGQFTLIEIGRASCRERGEVAVLVAATWEELLITGELAGVVVAGRGMVSDGRAAAVAKLQWRRAPAAAGLLQEATLAPPTVQPGAVTAAGAVLGSASVAAVQACVFAMVMV